MSKREKKPVVIDTDVLAVEDTPRKPKKSKKPAEPKSVFIEQASTVWPFKLDQVEDWSYWQNAFTPGECATIIDIGNQRISRDAQIRGANVEKNIRDSKTAWIMPYDDSHWIFRRVTDIVVDLNSKYFNFDLFGFIEGFQFTRYDAPGGKYDQHIDRGLNTWTRKLSFVLQLSDPEDYKGGDLELYFGGEPTKPTKEQGFVTVFPSYVLHRVTPVTKGTRYSLVAWITGPNFK